MPRFKLKDCILIDCISFTCASVLLAILTTLSKELSPDFNPAFVLQLFLCTTLIGVLMYFTSRIPTESPVLFTVLRLLDVAAVILGIGGGVFRWFPWTWFYFLEVTIILTIVFIITYVSIIWQNKRLSDEINERIKERENEPYYRD